MNRDDNALVPALDPLIPEEVTQTIESQQQPLEDRDGILAALRFDPGWHEIQTMMQTQIDGYLSGKSVGITANMTVTEVGEKYLIASGVASALQDILNKVNSATTAVAEREAAVNAARQQGQE